MAETDRGSAAHRPKRRETAVWLAIVAGLFAWVVARLDVLPLTSRALVDGRVEHVARVFYSIDHPFHAARTATLIDAWLRLDTLRWVGGHHGGYPAEFFPLGLSAIAAIPHLITFGTLPAVTSYALTVVALFLAPALGFWWLARADGSSPGIAVLATAAHLTIASTWLQGGFTETIEWGLVTNAAGALFALLALPALVRWVERGNAAWGATAALCIALCVVCNPRALIAVAVVGAAVALHIPITGRRGMVVRAGRLAVVVVAAVAGSAPVLLPLLRYSDLYTFLHFEQYADVAAYARSSVDAVTWPLAVLAGVGGVAAWWRRRASAAQVVTIALALYVGLTVAMIAVPALADLVPQLELPRLMPFQRLLTLWLAAYGAWAPVAWATSRAGWTGAAPVAAAIGSIALIVVFTTASGMRPEEERSLREIPRLEGSSADEFASLRAAVTTADGVTPDGTAILILGTNLSWHEQLWAPAWSDRRFLYSDWLWTWHRDHAGPYDAVQGNAYPNPSDALTAEHLAAHGIGAVLVSGQSRADVPFRISAGAPLEVESAHGAWQILRVTAPAPLVTLDGMAPDALTEGDDTERIVATWRDADAGSVTVRTNWHPRWQATVNGESVAVSRTDGGYMAIGVPAGEVDLTMTYGVTALDVAGRVVGAIGALAIVAGLVAGIRPIRGWARR